ncbi:hypothetical protein BDV18DRAFT_166021 [Aspergillus unguis]
MASNAGLQVRCAENIALFSLLSSVPALPSRNSHDYLQSSTDHHIISPQIEKSLTSTLAFLSHSKDDPDYIPAICLHPEPDLSALNVIFAVNKSSYTDGETSLCRIEQGFEHIFSVLATSFSASSSQTAVEKKVLEAVIAMCSPRILQRLRLVPSRRNKKKQPFNDTLRDALLAVNRIPRQKLRQKGLTATADSFKTSAREVIKIIDAWSRYQVDSRLMDVVDGIHAMHQIQRLADLVDNIPNRDMDPKMRESLLNIVAKVSRYREAARFLYRKAKHIPLVRKMKAVPVRLPREAFDRALPNDYTPSLATRITETMSKRGQKKLLKEACTILGLTQEQARSTYSTQVMRTLKEGKIHAEVQLVAYCELQRPGIRPRAVCSSKDACFLCNVLLQEYGKISIPGTHGRLYPGWRLPFLPQLSALQQSFCQALENDLQQRLDTLLATRRRTMYDFPNESTLASLALSSTTMASASLAASRENLGQSMNGSAPRTSNHSRSVIDNGSGSTTPRAVSAIENEASATSEQESTTNPTECGKLAIGEVSRVYSAGSLHIQLEHATGSKDMQYQLKWLGNNPSANELEDINTPVIDAKRLEDIMTISGQDSVYLVAGDTGVCISWGAGLAFSVQ